MWLAENSIPAIPYHPAMDIQTRIEHQEKFLCEEDIVTVATTALGLGIDKPDVRFIAHLDLPKSVGSYYQETGRAGRGGRTANAWMFYGPGDVMQLDGTLCGSTQFKPYHGFQARCATRFVRGNDLSQGTTT